MAYSISGNYSLHTATPVAVGNSGSSNLLESASVMSNNVTGGARPRNLSRGTSGGASFDSSNDGSYYEY